MASQCMHKRLVKFPLISSKMDITESLNTVKLLPEGRTAK